MLYASLSPGAGRRIPTTNALQICSMRSAEGHGGIASHVKQLRMLLAKKKVVEYESRQANSKEASEAVRRAERFVTSASQTIEAARL
jgi:hypothetical protein